VCIHNCTVTVYYVIYVIYCVELGFSAETAVAVIYWVLLGYFTRFNSRVRIRVEISEH